jgi:hypothetical protein
MHFSEARPEGKPSASAIPIEDPTQPSPAQQEAVVHPNTQTEVVLDATTYRPPAGILEDATEAELPEPTIRLAESVGELVLKGKVPEAAETSPADDIPETYDTVAAQIVEVERKQEALQELIGGKIGEDELLIEMLEDAATNHPTGEYQTADLREECMTALRDKLGDQGFADIEEPVHQFFQVTAEGEALAEKSEALSFKEYGALVEELIQGVDWDEVIRADVQGRLGADSTGIWSLMSRRKPDQQSPEGYLLYARKCRAELEAGGFMRDETTSPRDDSALERQAEWLPEGDEVPVALSRWKRLTEEAIGYISPEREEALAHEFTEMERAVHIIDTATGNLGLGAWDRHSHPPRELVEAFRRQTARLMDDFDKAEFLQLSESYFHDPLYVEGTELAAAELGIDPHTWVQERKMNDFPTEFTRGLNKVRFTDEDEFKEREEIEPNGSTITVKKRGHHDSEDREIALGVDPLFRSDRDAFHANYAPEQAERRIRVESLRELRRAWDHEAAHYAHRYTLPVSWLRQWQAAITSEAVRVTPYVERKYRVDGPFVGGLEDLADSVRLYKNNPADLLLVGGHERFRRINELFNGNYNPEMVEQLIGELEVHHPTEAERPAAWVRINKLLRQDRSQKQAR